MADRLNPRGAPGNGITAPRDGSFFAHGSGEPDVVDAEFETIAREAARPTAERPRRESSLPPPAGMATLRAEPREMAGRRAGPVFWMAGMAIAAAAFWVSGGHALVRSTSFLAQDATDRALAITALASKVDVSGARPVLMVDGEVANEGASPELLPPLDIVVTGNDGRTNRYRLGTSARLIVPGERFAFSSRLDVPKNGVRNVTVTFGR